MHQIESIGWGGDAASSPVAHLQQLGRPIDGPFAGTNGHQHAGNIAHHVVQESIGVNVEVNAVASPTHVEFVHDAHRIFRLTRERPEGREIVFADEVGGRPLHASFIEGLVVPGDLGMQHGGTYPAVEDDIAVPPRGRAEASMKVIRDRLRPCDGDANRQIDVSPQHPGAHAAQGLRPGLKKRGWVATDNLVPWKAKVILALALTKTSDPDEIQELIDTH